MSFEFLSFTSLPFFLALFVVACGFYLLPLRWRTAYLLLASYGFYATWSLPYLALLTAATATVFVCARAIAANEKEILKKLYLFGGVGSLVGLVVAFKLEGQINGVMFPLGLSYYSFKLIAYLVDVYWDERAVQKNILSFALYPAFFPQILSGPIQRADDFFVQLRTQVMAATNYDRIESGFRCVLGGLMLKMLVGDRLGAFVDSIDSAPADYNWSILLVTILCYTLQLYADFAGYTNVAIGVGKIFGIDSPPNFNAPFAASNIQEMWRRWHMSLTSWLTDYLFLPLQMLFRRWGRVGLVICITINMVTIGLWHGLTVNFLVFGFCHALFLTITALTTNIRKKLFTTNKWGRNTGYILGVVTTFLMMTSSQLFFHAKTWSESIMHWRLLLRLTPAGHLNWSDLRTEVADPVYFCMFFAFYIGVGMPGLKYVSTPIKRWVPNWLLYALGLLLLSVLTIDAGTKFIYGQF